MSNLVASASAQAILPHDSPVRRSPILPRAAPLLGFPSSAPLLIDTHIHWLQYINIRVRFCSDTSSSRTSRNFVWIRTPTMLRMWPSAFNCSNIPRHQGINPSWLTDDCTNSLFLAIAQYARLQLSPTIFPGIPSGNAAVSGSQESPLSLSAVTLTLPTVHPHCSNPPIPLVALPPPDFNLSPGIRSCQHANLFKVFGKEPAPLRRTASKIRPREMWERGLREFWLNAGAETRDGSIRKAAPKSKRPHLWSCTGAALILNTTCLNPTYP